MDKVVKARINETVGFYAKYFAEDFSNNVINHLKGSVSIDTGVLSEFTAAKLDEVFTQGPTIDHSEGNSVNRYLVECATYAVTHELNDLTSRDTWDSIKDLPSNYHDDLSGLAFESANLYQNTVDQTILSVIGNDARSIASSISGIAQTRVSSTQTGGRIHQFGWGILSDGMWLSSALNKAHEIAKVFKPNAPVTDYYAKLAFTASKNYLSTDASRAIPVEDRQGYSSLLLSHADETILSGIDTPDREIDLSALLFRNGTLAMEIERWEHGLTDVRRMVESVSELSYLAQVLPHLVEVATKLADDNLILKDVVTRIEEIDTAVTLCLVSFEALRETVYEDKLILRVNEDENDPLVDVFVNSDNFSTFVSQGGTDQDLTYIGAYIDPRRGITQPRYGYPMSWFEQNKERVVAQMAEEEYDRIESLRRNDATFIRDKAFEIIQRTALSYADAKGVYELSKQVTDNIKIIARDVVSKNENTAFSLEDQIIKLLVDVVDDPFVSHVANTFVSLASSENEAIRNSARGLTFVDTALTDIVEFYK